jgi:hypothetical protein
LLQSFPALGIYVLAFGLIPESSRSADIVAHQPTFAAAGSPAAENPAADYSYLLTPFKLASQPNLKQSVFGFAGRTNSGNLKDTFAFGVGAPQRTFYDNYIAGGAYQRDFFQFNREFWLARRSDLLTGSVITKYAAIPLPIQTA